MLLLYITIYYIFLSFFSVPLLGLNFDSDTFILPKKISVTVVNYHYTTLILFLHRYKVLLLQILPLPLFSAS